MLRLSAGEWQAQVSPECGMNLMALSWCENPIFRTPTNENTLKNNLFLYGNPLLLPANRTQNGRFSFQGRNFTLPLSEPTRSNNLHGQMADAPFEVVHQTVSEVQAIYRNRGERYPFAFDMTITDVVTVKGWMRTAELLALEDMPYTLAFHSTFVQPDNFSVPIGRRCVCDENYIPTGKTVEAEPFGKVISGFYQAAGHMATVGEYLFTVSENFDHWILFNGGGEQGFLCIEPQCGGVNGLNTDAHRILKARERDRFTLKVERRSL